MMRISLIIPTHNRAVELLTALESVVRQTLSTDLWECVVVDNASTDDTAEAFDRFVKAHPQHHFRMIYEAEAGVSHARNRGIRETKTELMAFIDDDERICPEFLQAYVDFFDKHPEAVVAGGRIIASYPTGRPKWMSKYVEMPIANPMHFGNRVMPFPVGRVPGGGNMAFRREAFDLVAHFDSSLGRVGRELIGGEENDLFERLIEAGQTIWYVPCAVMWHIIPERKLQRSYFRKLARNVGLSQRLRAKIHHRRMKSYVMELAKWGATFLLCLTMRPSKSVWLLRLRWGISRGLFGF